MAKDDGAIFSDLLLVAAAVARCPASALSIASTNGAGPKWATLAFGVKRESLDDPALFSIIASCDEAVEIVEPARNPALAGTLVAKSGSAVRWLFGVRLSVAPPAVLVVVDTAEHELATQERSALLAIARFTASALQVRNKALGGPAPGGFLHCKDVAALFDVSQRTVLNWATSGKLPSIRTPSGGLRFRPEDVLAWLS